VRSEYASDTDCLGCHPDKKDDWRRSIYGLIHYDRAIPPERRGCEGCHGPGGEHVVQGGEKDWIVNPAKLDRRSVSRLCMSCHAEERLIRRQAWHFTDHHESHVTCLDCHSVHRPKADKALSDEPNRLCLRCHADQKSYFTMTSHHPVKAERNDALRSLIDGKVRCIDCHQAYSAKNPRMLRGDKNEACLQCHPEFRGPFLFQHGGGNDLLADGCATCHIAHGSPNRYLLKRPDRTLCLTCHTDRIDHFPGPTCYSTGGCHNDIHGSNSNRWMIGGLGGLAAPARFDPMVGSGP
jgi:DmsE family decaheme c-type cytochrome